MAKLEKILKGRFEDAVKTRDAFGRELEKLFKGLEEDRLRISQKKKDGPELTHTDFKQDIIDIQKKFHKTQLMELNANHIASGICETVLIAKLMGLKLEDLEMDEHTLKSVQAIADGNNNMFALVGGEVVVANDEAYDFLTSSLEQRISDDAILKNSFNMIQ